MPARWFQGYVNKALTRGTAYTSLDAMKLMAIVTMTIDHIGYYFYPYDLWWRAIGRINIPVWFFLVGFSRSRTLDRDIWIYALLLALSHPLCGYGNFPFNVLVSMILSRYFLNFCDDHKLISSKLPPLILVCMMLSFITWPFFEYGSIGFLFALFGRMKQQGQKQDLVTVGIAGYLTYIYWQFDWFKFSMWQREFVTFGALWTMWYLATFTNKTLWADWRTSRFKTFVTVLSRNTMPYYFYHRLAFEITAAFALHEGFHLKWL